MEWLGLASLANKVNAAITTDRTRRRTLRTRRRLLDAALALFTEKSISGTSIEEITERADVGKGTFYRYFPSKDAVMLALVEEGVDRLVERIRSAEPRSLDEALTQLLDAHVLFFKQNVKQFLLLFQGQVLLKLQQDVSNGLDLPYMRYLEVIERRLAPFIPQPVDWAKVRRLACALAGFVSGFLSFAMIGMREQEIENSLGPLRRAFVASSAIFLGSSPLAPVGGPPKEPQAVAQ